MFLTHRDCGDENDTPVASVVTLAPLPRTIITRGGTKIYPPVVGNVYIVKHSGKPAEYAEGEFTARLVAKRLEN